MLLLTHIYMTRTTSVNIGKQSYRALCIRKGIHLFLCTIKFVESLYKIWWSYEQNKYMETLSFGDTWYTCVSIPHCYQPCQTIKQWVFKVGHLVCICRIFWHVFFLYYSVNQIVRQNSEQTALTFVYLPPTPKVKTSGQYLQCLTELTADLPPTVLVHGVSAVTSTTLWYIFSLYIYFYCIIYNLRSLSTQYFYVT